MIWLYIAGLKAEYNHRQYTRFIKRQWMSFKHVPSKAQYVLAMDSAYLIENPAVETARHRIYEWFINLIGGSR